VSSSNVANCELDDRDSFNLMSSNHCLDFDKLLHEKAVHLSPTQAEQMKGVVHDFSSVFSDKPGCVNNYVHKIRLKPNSKPVSQRPYRMSPDNIEKLRVEVNDLLKLGLIEPSHSEWASPAILVPKADGSMRCVIDYRKVNNLIEEDSFPMPRIDDLIDRIKQSF
jgi:hypothetical protein